MWSKKRKKLLKAAHERKVQTAGSKQVLPRTMSGTALDHQGPHMRSSSIPPSAHRDGAKPPLPGAAAKKTNQESADSRQTQQADSNRDPDVLLPQLSHIWNTKGPLTEAQLAEELKIPLNRSTKPLLANLHSSLLNAGGRRPGKNPVDQKHERRSTGHGGQHRTAHGDGSAMSALSQLMSHNNVSKTASKDTAAHDADHSRRYSQQTSYTTNMSISDSSNGSASDNDKKIEVRPHSSVPSHVSRNSGGDLSAVDRQNSPMTAHTKVQNYLGILEETSQPGPPPPGGSRPPNAPPPGHGFRPGNFQRGGQWN